MNVINPNDTTHNITVYDRYNLIADALFIKNENTGITQSLPLTELNDVITFDLTCLEGDEYSFYLENNGIVIYRGKIFVTSQVKQNYKINE